MKRIITIFIMALTLGAVITSCENRNAPETVSKATADSLGGVITEQEKELGDMMATLNEIQEGFRKINEAQGRISIERQQGEQNKRKAILEDMRVLQQTMQLNQQLISNLRRQLKESISVNTELKATLEQTITTMTAQMDELRAQVDDLSKQLAAKDIVIAEQETQIGELKTNVNELTAENDSRAQTISAQDKDLHTAYYVFGTKKELKSEKILKDGDVLQQSNFNRDYFTKIDIRVDKVIKLYSKSAELKTTHPSGSYTLERDSNGLYTLRITDATKFWSISKYLVIVVK